MRIRIHFYLEKETALPYAVNYPLASYLYRSISAVNPKLGAWLHDQGISYQGRSYKPLLFSSLYFEKRKNLPDHMLVKGKVTLQVDSIRSEVIESLIEGLWKQKEMRLFDVRFPLMEVQVRKKIAFSEQMKYKTLGPIVVPIRREEKIHFCHPLESEFYDQLRLSIRRWYWLKWSKELAVDTPIQITIADPERFQLQKSAVLTEYLKKKIKGYRLSLLLAAPPDVQQVVFEAGMGSYGSQGFGMLEVIEVSHNDPRTSKN